MSEKKKIRALGTISTNATQDPFLLCLHYIIHNIMHYAYDTLMHLLSTYAYIYIYMHN